MNNTTIFVFSSNLAGKHDSGSALYARKQYGAIGGASVGLQGKSFAIPTKDRDLKPLSLKEISYYVSYFVAYAKRNSRTQFIVSDIGCSTKHTNEQIANLFIDLKESTNVMFNSTISKILKGY